MATSDTEMKPIRESKKTGPLYKQLYEVFRSDIASGRVSPGKELLCAALMAKKHNVGFQTVKSAYDLLTKDGYVKPSKQRGSGPVVKTKKLSMVDSISFICWYRGSMSFQISQGINKFCNENKIIYNIDQSDGTKRGLELYYKSISNPTSSGIIVLPDESPQCAKVINLAVESGVKVVFVDRLIEGVTVSSVMIDNTHGAYQATNYLLSKHSVPVYFIGNSHSPSSARDRSAGWSLAMTDHGFHDIEEYIVNVDFQETELSPCGLYIRRYIERHILDVIQFLKKHRNDEKICCFALNDHVAKAIYLAAEQEKMKIGKQIFVFGFGDFPLCENLSPDLSSVSQENHMVGYEAARLLNETMTNNTGHYINRTLCPELKIRNSSNEII